MTDSIKNFIEQNIYIIDNQNWEELVEAWYKHFCSDFFCPDDYFTEFAEVLQAAGINFMTLSQNARKEFMSNLIDQILYNKLESMSFRGKNEVKKSDILMHVDCVLGFTEEELDQIMEDVAENKYDLEPDFKCFYVR